MTDYGVSASHESRLLALRAKHSQISDHLEQAQKSPSTAEYYLKQLKKQKLILKDSIESLQTQAAN